MSTHLAFDVSTMAQLSTHLPAALAGALSVPQPDPAAIRAACAHLRGLLHTVASYVPTPIFRATLADPQPAQAHGTFWNGSLLFADLSGFTAMSERLSSLGRQGAEELSSIINTLFGALVDDVHQFQGTVLKFGGDALTAFFAADDHGDQHTALAANAALALQKRMRQFASLQTPAGAFRLQLRIGVHSGQVFVAQVGDHEHVEIVVTGRQINQMALAQEIAAPGEVVVSQAALALLPQARTSVRQSGFSLLHALPPIVPQANRFGKEIVEGDGDRTELMRLLAQVEALLPYLPHNLPHRFRAANSNESSGEFRAVTTLFANFFPFTQVLDILGEDAQTAAEALNRYYSRTQRVVHRYGGIINKVDTAIHGDKLMALFGAPLAYEDSAERAVRAALDMRDELPTINKELIDLLHHATGQLLPLHNTFFTQRVGIDTGVVFAGQVGTPRRREYTVMGQHVNLAARLMSAAEAGGVVVSQSTRRLSERSINMRDLPPVSLKGIAAPVAVAEALHSLDVPQERAHQSLPKPGFVGRNAELREIIERGRAALNGSGQVLALVGEPGTGKTRLIEAVLTELVGLSARRDDQRVTPFFPCGIECQSYEQNTTYATARDLLRQVFSLPFDHTPSSNEIAALQQRIDQSAPDMARFAPLLYDVLNIPFEETPITAALTPEQRHNRTLDLAETLVLAEAANQPLLLIIDDMHWIDSSSLEFVGRLAATAERAPLLLILGYRTDPRIAEPWARWEHATRMLIGELPTDDRLALLASLLGSPPPTDLVTLLEPAQGNPFFIEEVVRGLVEAGVLMRKDDAWQLTSRPESISIPDTIEGVITARLDRLDDQNRDVLQTASVIGRRFPYVVLSGVLRGQSDLEDKLGVLSRIELIIPEELERDLTYLFKHALTRDVAYQAILYARRRELHRRVAVQLENLYHHQIDEQLALLARHYLVAEEWAAAFSYHLRAGRRAQRRYANADAVALLDRAIQIAQRMAETGSAASAAEVIEAHERLGVTYALVGEYDAALVRYQAALALQRNLANQDVDATVRLHHHIARVYEKRAEFDTAFAWVESALGLADAAASVEAIRCLLLGAGLHKRQGRYAQAIEWGERALAAAEAAERTIEQAAAYKIIGTTSYNLGETTKALHLLHTALSLYEKASDLDGISYAHNDLAVIHHELVQFHDAQYHYEKGLEIKQMIGDIYGESLIRNNLGDLFKAQGDIDAAIRHYHEALTTFEGLNSVYASGVLCMNLGSSHVIQGDLDAASEYLQRSMDLFNQANAEDFLPELERYIAELHLAQGNVQEAHFACELSLATAQRLEARTEEGATRRILAKILAHNGQIEESWDEAQQSLAILREADSPQEMAKTLLVIAAIAPHAADVIIGQHALNEAVAILEHIGAQRDLDEAHSIATSNSYRISSNGH